MSYCQQIGKDKIIFATKEDHSKPSTVQLADDSSIEPKGLILENGQINWNCPCLGGMASGPCGYQFREAFSCFHYSSAETKGSDCIEKFAEMQECMNQFPNLYPNNTYDDTEESDELIQQKLSQFDEQNTNEDKSAPNVEKHVTNISGDQQKT